MRRHGIKKYVIFLLPKDIMEERGEREMNEEKKLLDKVVAKAAYQMAKKNVNSACFFYFYQPKIPDALKKLKDNKC